MISILVFAFVFRDLIRRNVWHTRALCCLSPFIYFQNTKTSLRCYILFGSPNPFLHSIWITEWPQSEWARWVRIVFRSAFLSLEEFFAECEGSRGWGCCRIEVEFSGGCFAGCRKSVECANGGIIWEALCGRQHPYWESEMSSTSSSSPPSRSKVGAATGCDYRAWSDDEPSLFSSSTRPIRKVTKKVLIPFSVLCLGATSAIKKTKMTIKENTVS